MLYMVSTVRWFPEAELMNIQFVEVSGHNLENLIENCTPFPMVEEIHAEPSSLKTAFLLYSV